MASLVFTVPGNAKGWQRAGKHFVGGKSISYTPKQTRSYEALVATFASQAMKGRPLMEGPLKALIEVHVTAPVSASKKAREAMLTGQTMPTVKPDLDNVAKGILDALNGVAYFDDKQIVDLSVTKRYFSEPSVSVAISSAVTA